MIIIAYISFSALAGVIIGNIYGWKAGLLAAVLWPVALAAGFWDWLREILYPQTP